MIKLRSYAKINLYLDIGKKLNNGYHNIESLFQTINLFDEITIEKLEKPIYVIQCNDPEVPIGKNSLIYRAIEMILRGEKYGVAISINKKIPLAAGLGGGSSNIATILLGICTLFQLDIKKKELLSMATSLGMDIPFFLERGTVYARGRGEILSPLKLEDTKLQLVLVNPGIKISTKWAYQAFDRGNRDSIEEHKLDILKQIRQKNIISLSDISEYVYNRFDTIICKEYPIIKKIKSKLMDLGAISATISGSGPTVYGILNNKSKADDAYDILKREYPFVCRTITIRAEKIFF
jgi:4-diphosphocytidyl-2-C-methyl-D-erythritol kinase